MSIILDALKKSESNRQRESGPGLFEASVAPSRGHLPRWALWLGVVVGLNLLVLLWLLLRTARPETPHGNLAPATAPVADVSRQESVPENVPAAGRAAPMIINPADYEPALTASAAVAAHRIAAEDSQRASAEAARNASLPTRDQLVAGGRAQLAQLQISLHAYDPSPAKRFVFIGGQRAREGDTVGNGVVLETITRSGAILSVNGQRFTLPVQ